MSRKPTHTDPAMQQFTGKPAGRGNTGAELNWENEGGHRRTSHRSGETSPARDTEWPQRLAAEHSLLLRNVVARADDVLTTAADGRWPEHELAGLIDYLRSELISQTRIEEQLLFGDADTSSSDAFSRLTRDHTRLRYALEALTDSGRDRGRRDPQWLAATVRGLVTQLSEHLGQEREVLSRHATQAGWQRAGAAMEHRPHAWYALTHEAVINLDAFSTGQDIEAVLPRVQQLRPGDGVELVGSADPRHLCSRLLRDEDLTLRYLDDGPQTWRVCVTRRPSQ